MARIVSTFIAALALSACSPVVTGKRIGGDTGADDTDGIDVDTDGSDATDGTTEPEPVADFSVWNGERSFTIDFRGDDYDCDGDTAAEEGNALTSGGNYSALSDACGDCDHIYEVEVQQDEVCGYIELATDIFLGLSVDGDSATVYRFYEDRGDVVAVELDDNASFDGFTVRYEYVVEYYGEDLVIEGEATFPEQ